jgi:ribonuclease P/MRP protein subunit RPP1
VAVGEVVGFEPDAVREGLAEWGHIAAANRERLDDAYVEPGVRRGRYDHGATGHGGGGAGGEGEP